MFAELAVVAALSLSAAPAPHLKGAAPLAGPAVVAVQGGVSTPKRPSGAAAAAAVPVAFGGDVASRGALAKAAPERAATATAHAGCGRTCNCGHG